MQNIAEEIIEFADRSEAMALLGERDEYVRVLMENFDARFISRGEVLEISGESSQVEPAAKIMRELQYLYRQGNAITMHEVRYSIGLVKGGKGEALHSLFGGSVGLCCSSQSGSGAAHSYQTSCGSWGKAGFFAR